MTATKIDPRGKVLIIAFCLMIAGLVAVIGEFTASLRYAGSDVIGTIGSMLFVGGFFLFFGAVFWPSRRDHQ